MLVKIKFKESLTEGIINTIADQTRVVDWVSNVYSDNHDILIMSVPDNIVIEEFINPKDNIIYHLSPNPRRNWMTEEIIELFDWSRFTDGVIITNEYKCEYEIQAFHVVGSFMEFHHESLINQFRKWQDHLLASDVYTDGGFDAYNAIWESLK